MIEHGHNNGYGKYDYPIGENSSEFTKPRKVVEKTIKNAKIKEKIKEGLERRGLKVK